jgi:glycosyltransferase involved in cell wall biosynthesis
MEAAAMGRAVVATDVRGCREVVRPGRTGDLVPARDAAALAAALRRLAREPERRRAYAEAARQEAVERFDLGRCVDGVVAAYDELLARRPGARA